MSDFLHHPIGKELVICSSQMPIALALDVAYVLLWAKIPWWVKRGGLV
jgi:hypothetical protein